jgi:GLPGLI family protein
MKEKITLISLFCVIALHLSAQTTIKGIIVDEHRQPLPFAQLTLKSSYEEDIPRISWNIREDSTVTVFGYTCHYASTTFRGRKWEVWYTPDIPLDLGPWKFCGLPGLILQADCTGFIHIETCGISDKNLTPITFYNLLHRKFQLIDRRTFLKARTSPRSYPEGSIMIPDMELE